MLITTPQRPSTAPRLKSIPSVRMTSVIPRRDDDERSRLERDVGEVARREEVGARECEARGEGREQVSGAGKRGQKRGHSGERLAQRARRSLPGRSPHLYDDRRIARGQGWRKPGRNSSSAGESTARSSPASASTSSTATSDCARRPAANSWPKCTAPWGPCRRAAAACTSITSTSSSSYMLKGWCRVELEGEGVTAFEEGEHLAAAARDQAQLPRVLARLRDPRDLLAGNFETIEQARPRADPSRAAAFTHRP